MRRHLRKNDPVKRILDALLVVVVIALYYGVVLCFMRDLDQVPEPAVAAERSLP